MALKSRSRAKLSFHKAFDLIIPPIIVVFLLWTFYLCFFEIGLGYLYLIHGRTFYGVVYMILSASLIPAILALYIDLVTLPMSHDVPPRLLETPQDLAHYECSNSLGDLDFCQKGSCNGRWKPPRTHHCSLCGVCRVGFDHHCPWVGNCITLSTMKQFIFMLLLIPFTIFILTYPVGSLILSQATSSLNASLADAWAHRVWWDWWLSWLALGGPPGRWIIGTALGYRILDQGAVADCKPQLGCLIQRPHLCVVATATYASLLGLFALGLATMTMRQIHRGHSTVEALKFKKIRHTSICVNIVVNENEIHTTTAHIRHSPSARSRTQQCIMYTRPNERPYDLGARENWRRLMALSLFGNRQRQFSLEDLRPRLNPVMLQRMYSGI